MAQSQESINASSQRTAITEYLTAQIVPNHISPRDRLSFYRVRPVDDPDFEEMYDAAQGDPTLYAILVATDAARDELEAAQRVTDEMEPSRPEKVEAAKENLASLKLLEVQYRHPSEYPFNPVDGNA